MGNNKIRPIAMKCNQEQFEAVKWKLNNIENISNFNEFNYLVNNLAGSFIAISNVFKSDTHRYNRIVYEIWNEEIFLNACGIETEPTYTITKEQLLELENGFTLPKLKQWFPDVFEVKLEVGKWYKVKNLTKGSLGFDGLGQYTLEEHQNGLCDYDEGFNFKQADSIIWRTNGKITEATEQEIFEALKNEAVKRGFKEGVCVKGMDSGDSCMLSSRKSLDYDGALNFGYDIFRNGVWAEIIQTLTKKEAEEKLNCKII